MERGSVGRGVGLGRGVPLLQMFSSENCILVQFMAHVYTQNFM